MSSTPAWFADQRRARNVVWRRTLLAASLLSLCLVGSTLHALLAGKRPPLLFSNNSSTRLPSGVPQTNLDVDGPLSPNEPSSVCPQPRPLVPSKHHTVDEQLHKLFANETYKMAAYKAFGGAIEIPTESYEDLLPVGDDDRWDIFGELHEYLERTFPRVYESLEVTKVNTYGIVLHWQGSNDTALPVLMTAHQDVVPVAPATYDDWIHPPYSGYYDGTWIWGRGSCDDKSDLMASLQAINTLLELGFEPYRTFVWAFGFDEESAGTQGAGHLSPYLETRYGTHGFALLLDEGGSAYGTAYGGDVVFAFPGLSEKGYLDVQIEVTAPGGHSSTPPPHTAIGMLAALLTTMEDNPHPALLTRHSSAYNATQCAAAYAPSFPAQIRRLAREAERSDVALAMLRDALLEEFGLEYEVLLRTTQAIDLVEGGVKVNALPERAAAIVNHRIVQESSVAAVEARLSALLQPLASRFNLTMDAFGRTLLPQPTEVAGNGTSKGHVSLAVAFGYALDPSPVTPTRPNDPYQVLAGTIRGAIADSPRALDEGRNVSGVVVVPQIEHGNTDTSRYWNLTRNIVRYSHVREGDRYNGFHTVNEAIRAEGWLNSVRFYTRFILNCDEYL